MLDRIRVQCVQNILSLCFVECFNLFSAPYLSNLVKIRSFDLSNPQQRIKDSDFNHVDIA